jgi:flavin reductase (DIM6/NTAB) family NADH-FMN oxidoreductase RutF
VILDPTTLDRPARNALINGLVAPRPIAWVSSLASDGTRNLAPFSFFGAFSFDPPTIGVGPGSREGINKDTLRNIRASGEFVVNLVCRELAEIVNATSAEFGPDVDEWTVAGVTPLASDVVGPMRVAEAPAALECRVREIIELGEPHRASNSLIVAWIVRVHIDDAAIDGLIPNPDVLDLVGRMGGDEWCTTRDRFILPRPSTNDPTEVVAEMQRRHRQTTNEATPQPVSRSTPLIGSNSTTVGAQ